MGFDIPPPRWVRAQIAFDKAMERSTKYEKLSQSWFVPIWPYAFFRWWLANRTARKALREQYEIIQEQKRVRDAFERLKNKQ